MGLIIGLVDRGWQAMAARGSDTESHFLTSRLESGHRGPSHQGTSIAGLLCRAIRPASSRAFSNSIPPKNAATTSVSQNRVRTLNWGRGMRVTFLGLSFDDTS